MCVKNTSHRYSCKFSGSDYIEGPEEDGFEDVENAEAILLDILKEDADHKGKAFPKYI